MVRVALSPRAPREGPDPEERWDRGANAQANLPARQTHPGLWVALFRCTTKPKPQPGEQPSRGFGASTQGSVLAEGTEHKHQHPFWAGSSSARGFTAADFSVRISAGSGFCARGGSRTAPRAPIGWIVGSTARILRRWACGRVASTLSSTRSGRLPTRPRAPRRRPSSSVGTSSLPPAVTCCGRRRSGPL